MSAADAESDLKPVCYTNGNENEESPAATNGNGLHHDEDDMDSIDGSICSKTPKEEKDAIVELKEAALAAKSALSQNEDLARKVEAAVSALDEAVTEAEEAEAKAMAAVEEASLSEPGELEQAIHAVEVAAEKEMKAEAALDEAVLVVGEAVIKNLDRAVSATDETVVPPPTPTVEVTPAPQQEEEEEEGDVVVRVTEATPKEDDSPAPASPKKIDRQSWFIKRQESAERRREVEEQSRPTIDKAALSTNVDVQSVRAAYEDVRSDTTDTEWAVFKFQGQNIVCSAKGTGFDSFRDHFADNERVFGFIRIQMGDEMSKRQKFVFLTWVGPKVSVIRRAKMSIDKAMVKNIVKNFAVELQVESHSEISEEYLRDQLARVGGANYGTGFRD